MIVVICDVVGNGDWIINGEKWFFINVKYVLFFIVMVVIKLEVCMYEKMLLFIVLVDILGIEIVCNVGVGVEFIWYVSYGYICYYDVWVLVDYVFGGEG